MIAKNRGYSDFGRYYDLLGWHRFAHACAVRLENFVRLRGTGTETVLDLACGTGELEYALRKTKLKFVGVDLSRTMLAQARKKNKGVKFIRGDMVSVRLRKRFDIVVCFFDSVNHLLSQKEFAGMLKTARLHLKPGRFLIFDMISPVGLSTWESVHIRRHRDFTVITNGYHDPEAMAAQVTIEGFVRAGRGFFRHFAQVVNERSYPLETVTGLLARSGFKDFSVTAFDIDEPLKRASRWFFVVR